VNIKELKAKKDLPERELWLGYQYTESTLSEDVELKGAKATQ